jgi:hypothetical protein
MVSLTDCNGFQPSRAMGMELAVCFHNDESAREWLSNSPVRLVMSAKTSLKILFSCIFLSLLLYTAWASTQQSVLQWGGLTTGPDRYWTTATFMDAYFGFLTFYVWVFYKETRWLARAAWFIAIMLLGNMAMSAYVLLQLLRLKHDQNASAILVRPRS